ncbi:R3H domain-containing protein 4, partial [Silurus asotus]
SLIEERCSSLPSSPAKRVSPAKRKQFFISQAIRNSDLIPKAKGKKSLRRQENTRYLDNLLERDECSKDETEARETASATVFTEAWTNGNYMKYWSDFMNRSGEEQERVLAQLEPETPRQTDFFLVLFFSLVNPSFTAQACFQRIDRKLRATLKRKHIPKTTLEILESDLLTFFEAHPQSTYVAELSSSFDRLLLHAICQYMDLASASTDCNGARQTKVVNKQGEFLPPSPLLSAYLGQKS